MILRFMGDLPEPKAPTATPEVKEHGSLARRLKGSIGKKFGSSSKLSELAAEVGVLHHTSAITTYYYQYGATCRPLPASLHSIAWEWPGENY